MRKTAEEGASRAPRTAALAVLLMAIGDPVAAQESVGELRRFLFDDAVGTVHVRSFFLDHSHPAPPNFAAWAAGGWLGYQTGWLRDVVQFGAVAYTTQPLWAPADTDGTLLLKPQQYGFWVLGQAYASVKLFDQVFTAYRQELDELEVNSLDDRMIPDLFEAYGLRGTLGPVTYFAGYVARMKLRNQAVFDDMAQVAVNQYGSGSAPAAGLWTANLRVVPVHTLLLRASAYHVADILTSSYGDITWSAPLPRDFTLVLSSNVMVQSSNGANRLTGKPFSTWSAGARAILGWGDATVSAAYMQTGSASQYYAPYGRWIGYGKQITKDFDRANERAFQLGATYDFAGLGLRGLTFSGSATIGNGAIDPATRTNLANNTEYDLDLEYNFTDARWPDWLKPLALHGRAALIDINQNGQRSAETEYRAILNYELKFGGKGGR